MPTDYIIHMIIDVLLFACAGWLAFWVCDRMKAPQPIYWLVGGLFLVVLLVWLSGSAIPTMHLR